MPKRTIRCGSGHVVRVCDMIRAGEPVEIVYKTIAGVNCRQTTIGKTYRILKTTQNHSKAQLFMADYGKHWENTGLPWSTCLFLDKLVEFREYVFKNEIKNKAQEDTTNNSLV